MKKIPVGPYSYAILQALKAASEPLSRPLLARVLHDAYTPPIRPLWPVLVALEDAGLIVRGLRASRGRSNAVVHVWSVSKGAAWRLRNFTKTPDDNLD